MGIQDFGTIGADASLKEVIDALADLQDSLNFLLNGNLDVKNVRAKSITADRMDVKQLSAIAADLGKVVAGILIGAYISTADGTYPRIDFSSVNRLLAAYNTASKYVAITPSQGGTPGISWNDGSNVAYAIAEASIGLIMASFSGGLSFQSSNYINLNPTGTLEINGKKGWTGAISVITGVDFATSSTTFGIIVVDKGIITNYA